MRIPSPVALALLALVLGACPDDDGAATQTDTAPDVAANDLTAGDASPPDTGGADAESPDTTTPDAHPDAGPDAAPDVGDPDVGDPDVGDPDVPDVMNPFPSVPTLGSIVDRMGRPGVSTALIGTFDSDDGAKGAAKDAYNVAGPADWSSWVDAIADNLAIYDSLDTVCGNQLLAGPMATADRYDGLAGALADDQLYVNTAATTCTTYLAVEANATGAVPNADCGGRLPAYDVIDVTYSVLAIGGLSGVGDGVDSDDANPVPGGVFPFLAPAGPAFPSQPPLGAIVDRMGRPGISTALIGTFGPEPDAKGALKDAYNQDVPADWATWTTEIAANLAIYDSLDTVCGNQLLAGPMATADRYHGLAGALADDKLYVNTAATTCTTYLAVEANATGVIPNSDCGGRLPGYDVIDVTYSVLATGALSGVGDGVGADDADPAPGGDFPYLVDAGPPWHPAPSLGAIVDRMGRPGISTALIGTFNSDSAAKGALKDSYNQEVHADWAMWAAEMAANLAIYDSLDTVCGNQLLAGPMASPDRYAVLAGALADDKLYVNTASTTCSTYLAVEANATGILPNSDCGGRMAAFDVIDTTYSALAVGALAGVGDGVDSDDGSPSPTFPHLDAPGTP